jgi:Icc-related predicted phosphoesterase
MRVFLVSDVHVDYSPNKEWVQNISLTEFRNDALIVAGDGLFTVVSKRIAFWRLYINILNLLVTHRLELLEWFFQEVLKRFKDVFYIPGALLFLTQFITTEKKNTFSSFSFFR